MNWQFTWWIVGAVIDEVEGAGGSLRCLSLDCKLDFYYWLRRVSGETAGSVLPLLLLGLLLPLVQTGALTCCPLS